MGGVSEASIDASSSAKALNSSCKSLEHVGRHSGGGSGCRAWGGSAGIRGGATDGRTEGGKLLAHAVKSSGSAIAISARHIQGFLSISGSLVIAGLPLPFLGASCGFFTGAGLRGQAAGFGLGGLVLGELQPRASSTLSPPECEHRRQQHTAQHQPGPGGEELEQRGHDASPRKRRLARW